MNEAEDPATRAFREVGPNNPLRGLDVASKKRLWGLLKLYAMIQQFDQKSDDDPLELAARAVADAGKVAADLKAHLFGGPLADVLAPLVPNFFVDLPRRLQIFSEVMGALLGLTGKSGHKDELFKNQVLVMASEFVRLKLRRFYDEHVAELYQAIGNGDFSSDFSADAIRKKRNYLKRKYPQLYDVALERAESKS
jgi:hypothetical protein